MALRKKKKRRAGSELGRGFEVRPSIGRRSSGGRSDRIKLRSPRPTSSQPSKFWAFLLTVKRDTQKERTTKSRKSWGAKAVRVRATGSPRAHRCFAVGHGRRSPRIPKPVDGRPTWQVARCQACGNQSDEAQAAAIQHERSSLRCRRAVLLELDRCTMRTYTLGHYCTIM